MNSEISELVKLTRELFNNIRSAKNLVDDGKEVACSRSLQGAKTRCNMLLTKLMEMEGTNVESTEKNELAEENCEGSASGGQ